MGVIPEKTSVVEAYIMFEEFQAQGLGDVTRLTEDIRWRDANQHNYYMSVEGDLIDLITFRVESTAVRNVVEIFGEPGGLMISEIEHDGYGILLFYPNRGLVFTTGGDFSIWSSEFEINPDMLIYSVVFMEESDIQAMIKKISGDNPDDQIPTFYQWDGYGIIPE